ncbi:hypothetical protein [Actinomyces respiraculi]|uniref:ABC transporter domain-containing protein n=1 Tax=Actinomyces respiraculi TaxID=2744574 RepID=A0A7T0LL20_9ACTO|nr:hypothetical protein [Actinomyces respiraculi]QPL05411.1 hypothetical protein ID810_12095 [Actinomyces respiraculi]
MPYQMGTTGACGNNVRGWYETSPGQISVNKLSFTHLNVDARNVDCHVLRSVSESITLSGNYTWSFCLSTASSISPAVSFSRSPSVRPTRNVPRFIIFDEPSANLYFHATMRLADILAQLKRDGATLLVVEHRLRCLTDILDELIIMGEGNIQARYT